MYDKNHAAHDDSVYDVDPHAVAYDMTRMMSRPRTSHTQAIFAANHSGGRRLRLFAALVELIMGALCNVMYGGMDGVLCDVL